MKLVDTDNGNGKIVFKLKSGAYVSLALEETKDAISEINKAIDFRSKGEHYKFNDRRKA